MLLLFPGVMAAREEGELKPASLFLQRDPACNLQQPDDDELHVQADEG